VESGRVVRRYRQRIDASPGRVFPLLCPVLECDWLDGWADGLEMIHSVSGVAEDGCVFVTRVPGRPETVWQITRHEPDAGVVEFHRVTSGLVATRLHIRVEGSPDGTSAVDITYVFTPLNAAGAAFVAEEHSEEAFERAMAWWERSMNHWLRHGEILRPTSP
jgi:hypothetical protein